MDLKKFYDQYWTDKGDDVDHRRLNMMVKYIEPGKKVLEINCGIGILAKKIAESGADITVTDLSEVALQKTNARGIQKRFEVDLDTQKLPFKSSKFDIVVSNSMIEHSFYRENTIREGVRVLKDKGIFIIMVPNIGHWRFRLWLLFGRFPYIPNTPTDILHLRFFTTHSLKKLGQQFGLDTKMIEGNSALWVKSFYPSFFQRSPIRQIYKLLTQFYPALFARDILIIFEKR
jgi:ubiquinone/menaquinone biosynthesis C-methylase UbiE